MPRPERSLDASDGPVRGFAGALRQLRQRAGGPGYRELADRAGYSASTLAAAAGGRRLPAWPVVAGYVRACGGDVDEWRARWLTAATELAGDCAGTTATGQPPYPGLVAFGVEDAERFFGRAALVRELLRRVAEHRFLVVFGASGCGKSSVLRAGLVASAIRADPGVQPVVLTPGADPGAALARGMAGVDAGRALVVVDQFEEVFTLCPEPEQRREFVRSLLAAAGNEAGTRVVIGVRADFYASCARFPELVAAMADRTVLVGPMSEDEVRQAVTGPAALAGLSVERALVTQVLADAQDQPGALPLVAHALLETWLQRQATTLTLAGYQAAGGVRDAVARTAESVYATLTPQQQRTARHLLVRLTALGEGTEDTRRRVRREELDLPGASEVIDEMVRARLLVAADSVVEIAHEALIGAWPRLRGWLSDDREALRAHRHLSETAACWESLDRDPDALYRGSRLATAQEWLARGAWQDALTAGERRFLDESIAAQARERAAQARRARQQRLLTGALAVLLALSVVATGTAVWQWRYAVGQRREALSRQLAAQASSAADRDVPEALRLGLDAYRAAPTFQARSALLSVAGHRAYSGRLPHGGMVKDVVFSPDGSAVATAGQDGRIVIWNRAGRTERAVLSGHDSAVRSVAYGPDGRWLVSGALNGTVLIWDLAQGRVRTRLRGHSDVVDSVAVNRDGSMIASVGVERRILLWNPGDGSLIGELTGHGGLASEVAFSPDGRLLVSAGDDGTAVLWDLPSRSRVRKLRPGDGPLFAATFSPDGSLVATAGEHGDTTVWRVDSGEQVARLRGRGRPVRCLAFTPDGVGLISAAYDGLVTVWDLARRAAVTTLTGHTGELYGVAVSPDGATIAAASRDRSVLLWDRSRMPMAAHTDEVNAVAVAPDGRAVVSAGLDGIAVVWDPATRAPKQVLSGGDRATDATFSPDGRLLAVTARDGTIRLWDRAGGAPRVLTGHTDRVSSPAFDPSGATLATGSADRTVRIWELATATPTVTAGARHPSQVRTVLFTPDGRMLVSASQDGTVIIWDVARRAVAGTFHEDAGIVRAALDRRGDLLALGRPDGTTALWHLSSRTRAGLLGGHIGPVTSAAFSPDGRRLATAGLDQTIRLWSLPRHQLWATLTGAATGVGNVAWSPDGRVLYAGNGDHTVTAWPTNPTDAARRICTDLTADFAAPAHRRCRAIAEAYPD